ncbi:MAG: RHS repeat-associated core domain-containing protein [Pseudomonadota bacterium]
MRYAGSADTVDDAEFLYANRLGSIVARFDRTGTAKALNAYDEIGVPGAAAGTANTGRFRYTGQIWIPELGMYHYKARAYSPTLGRFMQTDPIGYGDGLNIYAYVGNDPLALLWGIPSAVSSAEPQLQRGSSPMNEVRFHSQWLTFCVLMRAAMSGLTAYLSNFPIPE